jgi:hypothetical protein
MLDKAYTIRFPEVNEIEQGKEFFFLTKNGQTEKIGFHDYDKIYETPGLYEHLFYDRYGCNSPEVVCSLLQDYMEKVDDAPDLRVLDVGAGNGMVGEQLVERGADTTVVGIDIIEEAASALDRDRPGLYKDYHVADLTQLPKDVYQSLERQDFNCLTVVAALGFGDIPPMAFARGYNLVSSPGWVAFNIKEDFVCDEDSTGFCKLIGRMDEENILDIQARHRYRHRFCQDGTPLYYYALVGQKHQDIPMELLKEFV